MSANEIHESDIGTLFKATIKDDTTIVDVSSASTLQLIFKKPKSGTLVTQTASLFTDGTDGIITYTSVSGDLNECGRWKLQGRVVIGTGDWKSDKANFVVHRNLE